MSRTDERQNTAAIRALERSNADLKKELAKLTRQLGQAGGRGGRSFFLGRGPANAADRVIERTGFANTSRDFRGGGLAAVTAGAIFGSAGALAAGGLTVARQYGKLKSISSDINMTSGQRQVAQIESVSGLMGGLASGFIQKRFNQAGITRRLQVEGETVSSLSSDLRAMAAQGIIPSDPEAKAMAQFSRSIAQMNFDAGQRAKRLGQDPTLAADASAAAEAGVEDLKAAITQAIVDGFAQIAANLRPQLVEAGNAALEAGNAVAYEIGVEAGKAYDMTTENLMNRTGVGLAFQFGRWFYNDMNEKFDNLNIRR